MNHVKTSPQAHRLRLTTGITVSYIEQGDPAGLPVLLLHGITDSWHSFESVLPLLPASWRVLAISQRGHGDSDRPADNYRPLDFAADAAAFLDAKGVSSAIVVGHSMGSHNAQRFAIDYPQRTRALVLIGAFCTLHDSPAGDEFWSMAQGLTDPLERDLVYEFQKGTVARPVPDAFMNTIVSESMKVPARVWKASLTGLRASNLMAELARVNAPTLIVWGDQDSMVAHRDTERLLNGIRGAKLLTYEGTGHTPHWEEPERFVADLKAFVQKLA